MHKGGGSKQIPVSGKASVKDWSFCKSRYANFSFDIWNGEEEGDVTIETGAQAAVTFKKEVPSFFNPRVIQYISMSLWIVLHANFCALDSFTMASLYSLL